MAILLAALITSNPKSSSKKQQQILTEQIHAYARSNAPTIKGVSPWTVSNKIPTNLQPTVNAAVGLLRQNAGQQSSQKKSPFKDYAQEDAFRRLQNVVGSSLQVYLRDNGDTPIQIKGHPLAVAQNYPADASQRNNLTARSFLRENAALLRLQNPDKELQMAQQQTDELGMTTIRYTQFYNGVQVWPAEIGVHLDSAGNVVVFDGAYEPTPVNLSTQPSIAAADAKTLAVKAASVSGNSAVTEPTLVIYSPLDQPAKLGWKMEVSGALDQYYSVVIDAANGATLRAINLCEASGVAGSGVDLLTNTLPLNVWLSGSTYYMFDTSKPMFNATTGLGVIYTYDARNASQSQVITNSTLQNIYYVTSSSATAWTNPDAVSCSYNLSQVWDYYWQKFGRNSYDGNGTDLPGVVRIGGLANAFWHWSFKMMFFGNVDRYAGSLDVIGHEVTHGVINSIGTQGVLEYQNQSGAINEAYADIFGEMVEARTKGTNDWLIGSQLISPVRNMANPAAYGQPSKMSQFQTLPNSQAGDNGGVHENSGIIDHAYYLLAAGLKDAIGDQSAEKIFYRSLTVYLKPLSQFIDDRLACITSAQDLFGVGSPQALATAEAFDAVEIYATPASAIQPVTVNTAVNAADSKVFLRQSATYSYENDIYRREVALADPASGTAMVNNVNLTKPAITGNGALMFLVGSDNNLYSEQTSGTGFTNYNLAGLLNSVAVSPGGRYVAFVFNAAPGIPTNQIYILDLVSNLQNVVNLKTPVFDGSPLNNIQTADSMSFSPDEKTLIYDALSTYKDPSGVSHQSWSIYGLDVNSGQQFTVVPPIANFQIGNPAFGHTSDRYIAFDALYTNGNSAILTLDLLQGTVGTVGVSVSGLGYPCFNGDDSYVAFANQDLSTTSGRSTYAYYLSSDKMSTNGVWGMSTSDAKLQVYYRRGVYSTNDYPPQVAVTSPTANTTFTSLANVTLTAAASDADGTISRVELYSGSTLLTTLTSAPYTMNWNNLPAGMYQVYAHAYDNQGVSSTSPSVTFFVKPPNQSGSLNRTGVPGFELSMRVPQIGLYRLETSTNLVNWSSLGSFYCQSNLYYWDSRASNLPSRFYRAVATP